MLKILRIRNFVLIESAEIGFEKGLNIVSGETGAGKSVLINSIAMVLGGKAQNQWIKDGETEACVEAVFDLQNNPELLCRLTSRGFPENDGELWIKRTLHRSGKNRITINEELASAATLSEICEDLVELCGQHEHQSLLRESVQMDLLDQYSGHTTQIQDFRKKLDQYKKCQNKILELRLSLVEAPKKLDYLAFQINEITAADLQSNEEENLLVQKSKIQSQKARTDCLQQISLIFDGTPEETGLSDKLQQIRSKSHLLLRADPEFGHHILEKIEGILFQLQNLNSEIQSYGVTISDSECNDLDAVESRLSTFATLKRKYGSTVQDVLNFLEALKQEKNSLIELQSSLEFYESELPRIYQSLESLGKTIHQRRIKFSQLFAKTVSNELQELKMNDSNFEVSLPYCDSLDSWTNSLGPSHIDFMLKTSSIGLGRSISRAASGGELSRITLAIRNTIASQSNIGVYLFDEIDTGMSGTTAHAVGKKLKSVSKAGQVICITHLPQVAAFADCHFKVERNSKTRLTEILELKAKNERVSEIARMIGGETQTAASKKAAQELLQSAR